MRGKKPPPKPRHIPSLYTSHTSMRPVLARRIVRAVLQNVEATGSSVAVAILGFGGNPIICEKTAGLGEAYWHAAIERAKALSQQSSSTTKSVTESAATLMTHGSAAAYLGVASLGGEADQAAVTCAISELAKAEEERSSAIAYNAALAKAQAQKKKTCRTCGKPLS